MASGRFISYLRVSTKRQSKSGLGLEAQREAVTSYLDGGRWQLLDEVIEIESGKRNDRPALARALALCRLRKATLVVARMDRLSRNLHFLTGLQESGCDFVCCDIPQANKLTLQVLASVAQAEGEAISTRTRLALAAAKRRGVQLGGDRAGIIASQSPKGVKASAKVRRAKARERAGDLLPEIESIRAEGASSLREIAAALNERGIKTTRGGEWSATQVARVLAQAHNASTAIR
jgi:DNA invertase Pin-like site-specific DNA recombinase